MKVSRFFLAVSFLTLTFTTQAQAQVTAAGSNLLRLGSGLQVDDADKEIRKRYFEEIANARIFFDNLSVGLRYEMDDPSEVGRSFQGLRRRWIQYKKDRIELQAGDFPALFGRGLTVNMFESRPLNYDAWLDGLYGEYENLWTKEEHWLRPNVAIRGAAGKLDYFDILHLEDDPDPDLRISSQSVNGEVGILGRKVLLGANFLQAFSESDRFLFTGDVTTEREVNQPGMYFHFFEGEFEGFFEWTEVRSTLRQFDNKDTSVHHKGRALYGSFSYANPDFGVTLEYKDYRYNLMELNNPFQTYFDKLPLSSPPEVYKEHVYTSITRLTHAVNFNDEVGAQAEFNISAIEHVDITLNASSASRHRAYGEDSTGKRILIGESYAFPNLNEKGFFPFWEVSAELEYGIDDLDYIKFIVHRTSNYDNNYLKMATTLASKLQLHTSPTQSFMAIFEHQWVYDEGRTIEDKNYLNEMLTLQYSLGPAFAFGGIFDYSTRYEKPHHIWPQGFISVRAGDSHALLLSYGSERGGLNCTGGICRVVPAFEGLRLTMTSQI